MHKKVCCLFILTFEDISAVYLIVDDKLDKTIYFECSDAFNLYHTYPKIWTK